MDIKAVANRIKVNNPFLTRYQIDILIYKLCNKAYSTEQLVKFSGIPKTSLQSILNEFGQSITFIKGKYKLNGNFVLNKTKPNLNSIKSTLIEIRKKYKLLPKRELDQFFATINTTIKKAKILKTLKLQNEENIALLGDDDFVSISIGLMYKNANITVFDTDKELLQKIKDIATEYNLNITTLEYNAKNLIASNYLNKYDIVLTDPPYTENGIELFLDRSLSLLKKGGVVLLNYGNSFKTLEKYLRIQEIFNKYNLFIKQVLYNYNTYIGAYSIGSKSSLYVLAPTENTKPNNITFNNIYTFEERDAFKFPYHATYSYKLVNVDTKLLYSKSKIDEKAKQFAKTHSIKIVDSSITKFNNLGFTFNYTLSSSSLVIHTWPELKAMHILIDVCSHIKNEMLMVETLAKLFEIDISDISFKKYF